MSILNRFKSINIFLLFVIGGYLLSLAILLALLYFDYSNIEANVAGARLGFFSSLLEDVVFFGLVGLGLGLAQFTRSKGVPVFMRLQTLFSNINVDREVLDYFQSQIQKNAVYAEDSTHTIEILEYDEEIHSYRIEFHNKYSLHNAFGDLDYNADTSIEIVPDTERTDLEPPAEVILIKYTDLQNSEVKNIIDGRIPIQQGKFNKEITIPMRADSKVLYEAKWWSYASNVGESGFSVKRFSKVFSVTIINRCRATARIIHDGSEVKLPYGEPVVVSELRNVPERTRIDFSWRPPNEHDVADPFHTYQRDRGLEFDRRHGEDDSKEV